MTYEEKRQQARNETLNKIFKIHGKGFVFDGYDEDSCGEQRDSRVRYELNDLKYVLKEIKRKEDLCVSFALNTLTQKTEPMK